MSTELFVKFILNGIIAGSLYAVLALGLSLLYGVLRFVNIAHGEYALSAAFAFYTFYVSLSWPLIPSIFAALAILTLITILIERLTFLPVREAPQLVPLIISIGVSILLKNLLLIFYGAQSRFLRAENESFQLFGSEIIRITDIQIIIIIVSIIVMISLWLMLKKTKLGIAIRAVSDNQEVAAILGIPINRIITYTFLIASLLAGIAGILAAFDRNLHPSMGTFYTIKAFAAVILGGIGSIPGAVAGGYIIGLAENVFIGIPFGDWYIPSNYKDVVAYVLLIVLLYIKPTGIFGKRGAKS